MLWIYCFCSQISPSTDPLLAQKLQSFVKQHFLCTTQQFNSNTPNLFNIFRIFCWKISISWIKHESREIVKPRTFPISTMIKTRNIKYTLVSVRFYFSSSTHWPLNPVAKHNCYTGLSLCTSLWSQSIQIRHGHDTIMEILHFTFDEENIN